MSKSTKSSLLSTEVTHALQLAQAALAAVLQEQKQRPVKPPPQQPSEVEQPVAKAADVPTKPRRKRGFRGTPPPAQFSLAELPDDSLLTEYEVAAVARLSTNTLSTWRKRPDHPLKWTAIGGGRIRYRVAAVKQYLATGHRPRPNTEDTPPQTVPVRVS